MFGLYRVLLLFFSLFVYGCVKINAQTVTPTAATTSPCALRSNTSCDKCLENVTCLWCMSTRQCVDYPVRKILPPASVCPLTDARWGLCWVNFQILIITMAVLAVVIIIGIFVCCFCCCKCERVGNKREDAKFEHQDQARKARHEERRTEMKLRHDEIRQKYGLAKGSSYTRMEDN